MKLKNCMFITFGVVYLLVSIIIVALVNYSMRKQALIEAQSKALMLLNHNLAIHTYFSHNLKPELFSWSEPFRPPDFFAPTWMSSTYAIRQIQQKFQSLDASPYYYKECAINARSPENEADPVEQTFLHQLLKNTGVTNHAEIRTINGQPFFEIMRGGEVLEQSCLRCHSTPDRAPDNLVRLYGPTRSFGRQLGEVSQAISIRIPLAEAYGQANRLSLELSGVLLALLGCLFLAQTLISKRWLFDPMAAIRQKALDIAASEARLGETIPLPPFSEWRELTTAFNTMSHTLRLSYDSLEDRVSQRTADLHQLNERLEQDIRQQQQAEETLRITRENLELAINGAELGTWDWHIVTGVVTFNERWAGMLGYRQDEIEPHVHSWEKLVHPEDLPGATKVLNSHLEGQTPSYEAEYRMQQKSGAWIWIADRGRVVARDAQGRALRACGMHQDITPRRQAQEALAQEAVWWRLLVEQSRDGIVILDQTGKVFEANQQFARMLGYSVEEARCLCVWDWDVQWSREELLKQVRLVDASGDHFETRHRRRDGSFIDVEISTNGVALGGKKLVFCVCRDISGRKAAERALRESEEKYRLVFAEAPIGIVHIDQMGAITDSNEVFAQIIGAPKEKFIGFDNLKQLRDEKMRQAIVAALRGEVGYFEGDYLSVTAGKVTPIRAIFQPLFSLESEPAGTVGLFEDITERRQAEAEKAALEAKLLQSQKMEAIGTLAGGIAHDFNNILWAIMGFTELTMPSIPEDSSEHHNLQQILIASQRAKDLVHQILTFSRKTDQERQPIQLSATIAEALNLLRATIPTTIEIKQDLIAPTVRVLADPTQMQQMIINLCTNAAYAMRDTGGALTIRLAESRLAKEDLRLNADLPPGLYAVLTVSDTGPGIAANIIDRIFDPFFTTKEVGEGTGMGLAVIYGIVKSHGGGISVASQPGAGASFTIVLPKIAGPKCEAKKVHGPIPRGNGRLLVVDDEKILVDLLKRMLETLGYEVTASDNSQEALSIFQGRPDTFVLIITDQTMPHLTGLQLIQEIRRLRPDIPIILCTGFSDQVSTDTVGVSDLLMKPITLRNLGEAVYKALHKKRPGAGMGG